MFNKTKFTIFSLVIMVSFFVADNAFAQATCEPDTSVEAVFRNEDGDYIPNITFDIYTQIQDADGNPRPGVKISSGNTSPVTGIGVAIKSSFSTEGYHVVKVYDQNNEPGAFYYYNEVILSCGSEIRFEKVLSGINFILRDTDGELVKNHKFNVFTQRYDVDNQPIKEKDDKVGSFDTSEEGEFTLYVSNKDLSYDRNGPSYYIFESTKSKGTFVHYDILIRVEKTTEIEYIYSNLKINLRDSNNVLFPGGSKLEMFEQDYDISGDKILGKAIATILTNDKGAAIFEHPAGIYVARTKGADNQYAYFWNLEIVDQEQKVYDLTSSSTWDTGVGACTNDSRLLITTTDVEGLLVANVRYEIYEENTNINGNPEYGRLVKSGEIDSLGRVEVYFKPDPRKKYALKIFEKNSKVGEYWFFDHLQFICGQDKEIHKFLPSLEVVLRDGDGDLKKDQKFSIYTQKFDTDDNPIKEKKDLVGTFTTNTTGSVNIHIAPDHPYIEEKRGTYVFISQGENRKDFTEYGINIDAYSDTSFEYVFSDIILTFKDAHGNIKEKEVIDFYLQERNLNGDKILGKKIKSIYTDSAGMVRFEYPYGYYAVVFKDDLAKQNIIWDVYIENDSRRKRDIIKNSVRVRIKDSKNVYKPKNTTYSVYSLIEEKENIFYKEKVIKSFKIEEPSFDDISLAQGPYLISYIEDKIEYGEAFYASLGQKQEITININENDKILGGQLFEVIIPKPDNSFAEKLSGNILLQVEKNGEAWYVYPKDLRRYYMRNGEVAYQMMRKFGLGITNANLEKIPVGIDERMVELDTDQDGLPDKMEEALGTNIYIKDTDGDGYLDGAEVENGFNPNGSGRLNIDHNVANKLKGQIVLQVESRGEAWYINPSDGKRYYMKDGDSAYEIMRFLSLGITNENLEKINIGDVE